MITLYTHSGPNPRKIQIALEELALPHTLEIVDVWHGEGQREEFLALNPNGKIPVIRDDETGQTVYESNAILLYLAEKTARLFPRDEAARWRGLQLLFFQAASIGPMFGQRVWFDRHAPERITYAMDRYRAETERLLDVVERSLDGRTWFLDEYSIVDIAHFGWIASAVNLGYSLGERPDVRRWYDQVGSRPAVVRAMAETAT